MSKRDNINKMYNIFLQQSYMDSWNEFEYILSHTNPVRWDWFIITASNEEQAKAYRIQIDYRIKNGWLPAGTRYVVIPDPEGKRVGSGGATLNVIKYIKEKSNEKDPFTGKRIVILHSGGDSKRVPQYSACGKLFSKVPRKLPDGRCSTLFDEFVIALSGVPARMADGMLVMSGDVLLLFNPLQIDLQRDGSACISIKAPVETGMNHGVFLPDGNGKVKAFLHKQSKEMLMAAGAVNEQNNVDIDTGAIWVGSGVLHRLTSLISKDNVICDELFNKYVNEKIRLNFYGDFVYPMVTDVELNKYLKEPSEGEMCDELMECRMEIFKTLNKYPMHLIRLSPGEFIHFGTTKELLNLMLSAKDEYDYLGWGRNIMSLGETEAAMINSFVDSAAAVPDSCYIEDSYIDKDAVLEDGCIISNTHFKGKLNHDTVLHTLPVLHNNKEYFVSRIYGTNDNPKKEIDDCTFLNTTLRKFIDKLTLKEEDIWEGKDRSLWNAKLYPLCISEDEAIESANVLQRLVLCKASEDEKNYWLKSKRLSLKESFNLADMKKSLIWQECIEDSVRINKFIIDMESRVYYKDAAEILGRSDALKRRVKRIYEGSDVMGFSLRYRIYLALSKICFENDIKYDEISADYLEDLCYSTINREIKDSMVEDNLNKNIKFVKNSVSAELPIRVNWGGGWSDTPPYCIEEGGTVINAALLLRGKFPIRVTIKRIDKPVIVFESKDSSMIHEFDNLSELQNYENPADPFALHKASLVVAGIIPPRGKENDLKNRLESAGGGLYICTDVDVPRGSGLGTSSILAGAVVKSLFEMLGNNLEPQKLFDMVLYLEQLITTGGGWQDQVGGLMPGVKLLSSKRGLKQSIKVMTLDLSDNIKKQLNERFTLVYTGQRRLARNLLREITGKYILNSQEIIDILNEIQHIAVLMAFELQKGNLYNFTKLLNEHWELSKKLDAGSTNTFIDQIIEVCRPYIDGVFIAGAGGGGFLQMILKDGITRDELNRRLNEVYQGSGIEVWETEFV